MEEEPARTDVLIQVKTTLLLNLRKCIRSIDHEEDLNRLRPLK